MAAAAILDFAEVKSDVSGSRGRPVSTSTPNLVKIYQRATELWHFMCFQNWRRILSHRLKLRSANSEIAVKKSQFSNCGTLAKSCISTRVRTRGSQKTPTGLWARPTIRRDPTTLVPRPTWWPTFRRSQTYIYIYIYLYISEQEIL